MEIVLSIDNTVTLTSVSPRRFTKNVAEENERLFNDLGDSISDVNTLDLLIRGLDTQNSPMKGYIYHYTHLENAVSILRDGALKSRHEASYNNFKDSAAMSVIQQTRLEVMDHARFFFRPLTPPQCCIENLGSELTNEKYDNIPMCPVPVIFRIQLNDLHHIADLQWGVSLGSMASSCSDYGSSLDLLKKFDFCGVFLDARTERGKVSSQQEFLIKRQLNLRLLPEEAITIICQDDNALFSLNNMLKGFYTRSHVFQIDQMYFFGRNPHVRVENDEENQTLKIMLQDQHQYRSKSILIVQLESPDDRDMGCTGNIICIFRYGHRTSIYGKHILEVSIDQASYAVYYADDQPERWLIHTNQANPHFDSSHEQHYRRMMLNIQDINFTKSYIHHLHTAK